MTNSAHRGSRLSRPLVAVLAASAFAALFWLTVMPPLQGPDEEGHFAYTQWIVERGAIPWHPGGVNIPNGEKPYSPEVAVAEKWAGLEPLLANLSARPLWTGADRTIWNARDRALPRGSRATGPPSATFRNPPLYYLYEAIPYEIGRGGSIFDRLYLMRLANVPLLVLVVWLTWLLAGELGAGTLGRAVAAAVVGLQPQLLNVTATVDPDVLLVALWTAGLYVAVRLVRQGWTPRLALAGLGLVAATGLTHPRGVALAAPVAVAAAVAATRRYRPQWTRLVAWAVVAVGALALVAAVVVAMRGSGTLRQFGSYVWQFYLPKLGFMSHAIGPPRYGFRQAFVDRVWSGFSDLEVTQPHWVTTLMFWLTLAFLVAAVGLLIARRGRLRERWYVPALPALGGLALLVVLHVTAYRSMLTTPNDPIITGRYLLPLLPSAAVAVALLLDALPAAPRRVAAAVVLSGVALMQLGAAGELLGRFYA